MCRILSGGTFGSRIFNQAFIVILKKFYRFYRYITELCENFIGFYRILQDTTGFYEALQNYAEFCKHTENSAYIKAD